SGVVNNRTGEISAGTTLVQSAGLASGLALGATNGALYNRRSGNYANSTIAPGPNSIYGPPTSFKNPDDYVAINSTVGGRAGSGFTDNGVSNGTGTTANGK